MPEVAQSGSLTAVTDATFDSAVLAADRPVVVDFWADWCPPCRAISRSLAELADEFAGRLDITTINSDENPETTRRYGVMSLPTLLVFDRGELVGSIVGARPKNHLRAALGRHVGDA
ncbi:thioredoxin [Micromonospora echinaurantiaca]|uniref:Thioredoxin n=1 Tax=Micromonospora echinaurantiaca TaxID=47857 RepID=A0A1C5KC19_9ACTN|nr:thioredoxin [Micromonospora echinaurantiaca]SCG80267.1 thioredoxin [Micromonospora echinaurantiaca]